MSAQQEPASAAWAATEWGAEALRARRISLRAAAVFLKHAAELPEEKQREILAAGSFTESSSEELERQLRKLIDSPKSAAPRGHEPIKSLKNGSFIDSEVLAVFRSRDPRRVRSEAD